MREQRNKSVINDAEDELLNTMKTKLDHLDFDREVDEPWTIHRVLHSIHNEHIEYYDPKIISIGPLHAGK